MRVLSLYLNQTRNCMTYSINNVIDTQYLVVVEFILSWHERMSNHRDRQQKAVDNVEQCTAALGYPG